MIMNNFKIYLNESIEMEKSNVHKILKYSEELQKMINPSDTLDDWIKAKLTHAADYLTTVLDYLKYYNEEHQISETKTNNRKNVYFLLKEEYTSEMSIGDLKNIHDKAIELKSFINKFSDLEDWVEAKLTLAGEYLDDVYHHLDYKKLNEINFKKALATGALFLSTLLPVSADTYLVQKGDTLSKISNVLDVSLEDLKKLNPNINPDKLQIGDEIKVPDKITNVYSIEKGDTLTKIARKMNVSLDDLEKINPNIDPNKLQIGQKINLPDIGKEKIDTSLTSTEKKPEKVSTGSISNLDFYSNFKKYLKFNENGVKRGYKNGKWYQYKSEEGGTDTIGYGHKLTPSEQRKGVFKNGLTDNEVNDLFEKDLKIAYKQASKDIDRLVRKYRSEGIPVKITSFNELGDLEKLMVVDFAFNLGSATKFPEFIRGLLNGDIALMKKEYKRNYLDKETETWKPLTQRNNTFYDMFLKNYEVGK